MGKKLAWQPRGASFVEVVLTLPIMLLCMLFLVDLAWYFVTYSVLSYAVHEGADIAAKIPVETDTSSVACGSTSTDEYKKDLCLKYLTEVTALLATVDATADLISSRGKDSGRVYRLRYDHYYETGHAFVGQKIGSPEVLPSAMSAYSGFIRPGERIRSELGDIHEHPSRPFVDPSQANPASGVGWPSSTESWASVLSVNPIETTISGVYKPLTPFFPDVPIRVSAFAYRKTGLGGRAPRTYAEHVPAAGPTLDSVGGGQGGGDPNWVPTYTPVPPAVYCSCCGDPSAAGCETFDMARCYACPCAAGCGAG